MRRHPDSLHCPQIGIRVRLGAGALLTQHHYLAPERGKTTGVGRGRGSGQMAVDTCFNCQSQCQPAYQPGPGPTSNSRSSPRAASMSSVLARGALVTAAMRTPRPRSQAIHSERPGVRCSLEAAAMRGWNRTGVGADVCWEVEGLAAQDWR
jgi:hypothetical protein